MHILGEGTTLTDDIREEIITDIGDWERQCHGKPITLDKTADRLAEMVLRGESDWESLEQKENVLEVYQYEHYVARLGSDEFIELSNRVPPPVRFYDTLFGLGVLVTLLQCFTRRFACG